jgi:hypothetical protein
VTHYERLRVAPSATADQIRDAYRRAAREAHPDRNARADAESRMAAINEAYRVLGDPVRRSRYDHDIAAATATRTSTAASTKGAADAGVDHDVPWSYTVPDTTPARFPWKFMAVLATLGIGVIVLGLIFSTPQPPSEPDNILRASDCVVLGPQLDAAEVACTAPHDAVVAQLIPFGDTCRSGTEGYRDRQGMGTACVVRVTP